MEVKQSPLSVTKTLQPRQKVQKEFPTRLIDGNRK